MRFIFRCGATAVAAVMPLLPVANAADGQIQLYTQGGNAYLQVQGSPNDDWRIQTSTDLLAWSNLTSFGALLSGRTNAPSRSVGDPSGAPRFFRAVQTGGLYDRTLLRTMSLTFTQANWQTLLANGRSAGTNVYCSQLTLDNGAANYGVGARYRGNTSYTGFGGGAPVKKSINLELDHSMTNQDLMGYDTVNLNNAYQDETILRESLYFNIMRNYTVCPAGCLMQLYINGANWGVYSFAQQQDRRLINEYFPSSEGDRWRAPNMGAGGGGPGGGTTGASSLGYLGNTNVATYLANYELKSDYNTNAWPRLINAIYVLNNTPT
ncbi:MAG: CotH kinase family protein, partial [Chloroflexi bacterium]|nr:CotH kinase family protein [Chloroflexota bacterium]